MLTVGMLQVNRIENREEYIKKLAQIKKNSSCAPLKNFHAFLLSADHF